MHKIVLVIVLFLFASITVTAQTAEPLVDKINHALAHAYPDWKAGEDYLHPGVAPADAPKGKAQAYKWSRQNSVIMVYFFVGETEEDAQKTFLRTIQSIQMPGGKSTDKIGKNGYQTLGTDRAWITFYRNNLYISLTVCTLGKCNISPQTSEIGRTDASYLAISFAKLIDQQITNQ